MCKIFTLLIVLYRFDCCSVIKADLQRIDALYQWCLRRILGIHRHDFVRNADVHHHMTTQPPLSSIFKSCCLSLFGHLVRMSVSLSLVESRNIFSSMRKNFSSMRIWLSAIQIKCSDSRVSWPRCDTPVGWWNDSSSAACAWTTQRWVSVTHPAPWTSSALRRQLTVSQLPHWYVSVIRLISSGALLNSILAFYACRLCCCCHPFIIGLINVCACRLNVVMLISHQL